MDQKKFYNKNAKKFLIYKSKYNIVDSYGESLLDELIGSYSGKSMLDYGCGDGVLAIKHLNKGADFFLGVDVSKELLSGALKRTINHKNIEFLSIDEENKSFDKIVGDNIFDIVVSYYVFCTIENFGLIKKIIKTLYKKLKGGGKILLVMPNRDKFNGKVSYGYSYIQKKDLKDGDEVITYLRTSTSKLPTAIKSNSSHLKIVDYFHSQNKLKEAFVKEGFQVKIHEVLIKEAEYKGIIDESNYSPVYVLEAIK